MYAACLHAWFPKKGAILKDFNNFHISGNRHEFLCASWPIYFFTVIQIQQPEMMPNMSFLPDRNMQKLLWDRTYPIF